MIDVRIIVAALLVSFVHATRSNKDVIKYRFRESKDFKIAQFDKTDDDVYNAYFDNYLEVLGAKLKESGDSINMRDDIGHFTDPEGTYFVDFATTNTVLYNISNIQRITNVSVEAYDDEYDGYGFGFSVKFPDAKATSNFFMRQNDEILDSWEGTTSALVGNNSFELLFSVLYSEPSYSSANRFQSSFTVTESNVTWTYQEGEDKWVDYAVEHALMLDGSGIFLALSDMPLLVQIGAPPHP